MSALPNRTTPPFLVKDIAIRIDMYHRDEGRILMTNKDWIAANAGYAQELLRSAWNGASSAWQATPKQERVPLHPASDAAALLATAAFGLATGVMSGFAGSRQKRGRNVVLGGLLGGSIAIAGASAWGMRTVAGRMAKGAARNVDDRRNMRWLEQNPINYA